MCGICGFTWDDQNLIRIMGNKIKHRGPEQEGFYTDENISLCCERLKILDLRETAKQPQHNEDSTIWVVLNGEIYNFRELREKLEHNHTFYTNSDTEVILHAYEEYGENCLDHLNGMFAFAIWDTKKKKLFLARDRLGVKPLYYSIVNDNLIFSSEIKSILQYDEVERTLNYSALSQFLTYAYTIDGQTLFKNIFELLPGQKLIYYFDEKKPHISNYWNLSLQNSSDSEDIILKKWIPDLGDVNLKSSKFWLDNQKYLQKDSQLKWIVRERIENYNLILLEMDETIEEINSTYEIVDSISNKMQNDTYFIYWKLSSNFWF